ncbi:hypothetical protein ElyMa_002836700 [Elysia marginata]|uniref:Uncharacterized protein n=1 Tax=Elysia marginata TaxID=1093978 RepID=A0AAV4HXA4_9GAST|nr:hypothetical protein ElyMa_002836700 [Elysia marginata]
MRNTNGQHNAALLRHRNTRGWGSKESTVIGIVGERGEEPLGWDGRKGGVRKGKRKGLRISIQPMKRERWFVDKRRLAHGFTSDVAKLKIHQRLIDGCRVMVGPMRRR